MLWTRADDYPPLRILLASSIIVLHSIFRGRAKAKLQRWFLPAAEGGFEVLGGG